MKKSTKNIIKAALAIATAVTAIKAVKIVKEAKKDYEDIKCDIEEAKKIEAEEQLGEYTEEDAENDALINITQFVTKTVASFSIPVVLMLTAYIIEKRVPVLEPEIKMEVQIV